MVAGVFRPDESITYDLGDGGALLAVTPREEDVLRGVCAGLTNRQIADQLLLGTATVKSYVSRLLEKFLVATRVGLVIAAYEGGLVERGEG